MFWYEEEVQALERAARDRAGAGRPPVFYGSSSIRLWDTLAEDFDPRVLNLGFGGSTLEACDHFFHRLIQPENPQSLLLYAGDNDLGDGRSEQEVLGWFRSIADKVAASLGDIPFGFVSVKPSPARASLLDRIQRVNEMVRHEIESRPAAYFVDVFPEMLDQAGNPRGELFLEDGLHMNHDGYRLWSDTLNLYRHRIFTH